MFGCICVRVEGTVGARRPAVHFGFLPVVCSILVAHIPKRPRVRRAATASRAVSTLAIKQRMRSVGNIAKITMAMKMVAASKMRSAQQATEKCRGMQEPFLKMLGDLPLAVGEKNVTIPVTTDKGLCGGINTMICKYSRATMKIANPEGEQSLVILGEKGKAQLQRDNADKIAATIADTQKVRLTFPLTCSIAEEILKTEYDVARIVYNRFVSAIAQKPTIATVMSPDALEKEAEAGGGLDRYEIEGPGRAELLQNLAEFNLATSLYTAMLENNCSEQSSRMSAMENSTKNAGEMLGKLTLTYNRTRQASITTELIEIISGATALED